LISSTNYLALVRSFLTYNTLGLSKEISTKSKKSSKTKYTKRKKSKRKKSKRKKSKKRKRRLFRNTESFASGSQKLFAKWQMKTKKKNANCLQIFEDLL